MNTRIYTVYTHIQYIYIYINFVEHIYIYTNDEWTYLSQVERKNDSYDMDFEMVFRNTKMTTGQAPCSAQNSWWPYGYLAAEDLVILLYVIFFVISFNALKTWSLVYFSYIALLPKVTVLSFEEKPGADEQKALVGVIHVVCRGRESILFCWFTLT